MADKKRARSHKKQMGQFMTPMALAMDIVNKLPIKKDSIILEPSFGCGAFLFAIIDKLLSMGANIDDIFAKQLYGVEIDSGLYAATVSELENRYGKIAINNLYNNDFFRTNFNDVQFDFIIGNPPFGGTFDKEIEDALDRKYGTWGGFNLKKETYSFFMARSLDLLKNDGVLSFISSDTFLTISTMKGLRKRLMDQTYPCISKLDFFSAETNYDMLLLTAKKSGRADKVNVNGTDVSVSDICLTDNLSWQITGEYAKYFAGARLSDFIVCTSGMTTGKNEYFIREIGGDGYFDEPYDFVFFDDLITLEKEISRARLGKLSATQIAKIRTMEQNRQTRRNVKIIKRITPLKIHFSDANYKFYNKSTGDIVYSEPRYLVYWKDDGDALYTYRKNANWYLHGVGGKPFFGRSGLTWQLISSRIKMRYLPEGYILDSGAPCAFLRSGITQDELFFIFAWTLTDLATNILKNVINHTRNIQSKDIERLPYPFWVNSDTKQLIITKMREVLSRAQNGDKFDFHSPEISTFNDLFAYHGVIIPFPVKEQSEQLLLKQIAM